LYRKDYADTDLDPKSDLARVRMINRRIKRGAERLGLDVRRDKAVEGECYLSPDIRVVDEEKAKKEPKPGTGRAYMPYLLPILEDAAERTIPGLPTPTIEDRNQVVQDFADRARQIIDYAFSAPACQVRQSMEDGLWEDARWGVGIVKTTWRTKLEDAEPQRTTDENAIASEVAHAQTENDMPMDARITDGDLHHVHIQEHGKGLMNLAPDDPDWDLLDAHIRAHSAEMVAISREWPQADVLRTEWYVYDDEVPWPRRGWEAEKRSHKIKTMFKLGYKNLNPVNLPPEVKPGDPPMAWEDMTAQVWEYHDRDTGDFWVIPVNGSEDGLPLFKGTWEWGPLDIYIPLVTRPFTSSSRQMYGKSTVSMCIPILERLAMLDYYTDRHIWDHPNYTMFVPTGTSKDIKRDMNDPHKRFVEVPPEGLVGMKEFKPPSLPDANLQQREMLFDDLRKITGGDPQDTGEAHPHSITAHESARRASSADNRTRKNQRQVGDVLEAVAKNFLGLYKQFATKSLMVRTVGPEGVQFLTVDPSDLPDEMDLYIDMVNEGDDARANRYATMADWGDKAMALGYPLDGVEFAESMARVAGMPRPDRYRSEMPVMGEGMNTPAVGQQPTLSLFEGSANTG
jgi:hypothetical protein